jgi:hypothetical protein
MRYFVPIILVMESEEVESDEDELMERWEELPALVAKGLSMFDAHNSFNELKYYRFFDNPVHCVYITLLYDVSEGHWRSYVNSWCLAYTFA